MGFVGEAVGSIVGGITGSTKAAKGAQQAANTQAAAADRAIAEQRAARDQSQQLQQPYVDAGSKSLAAQMALIGLNGTGAQQEALNALLTGPEYTTAVTQGEEAILQNAAATGGLRGGNTQNSLARFRADLLNSTIASKYNQLGGITSLGQNAAAGVASKNLASAGMIGSLLGEQASAIAGGQIAAGNSVTNGFNTAIGVGGLLAGSGLFAGKKAISTPAVTGF